jgi:glutamyl-tRNA reductase
MSIPSSPTEPETHAQTWQTGVERVEHKRSKGARGVRVVGLSHATAPLDFLERISETDRPLERLIADVVNADGLDGAVVFSTCNRLELYVEAGEADGTDEMLSGLLAEHAGTTPDELAPYVYTHDADDAVRHLFNVAAGLDSVVVGEDQILGQVKQALERSQRVGAAGGVLGKAIQTALRVGKQARNETGLNEAGRSLATAGLTFFERAVGSLAGKTALVIGAGSMAGVVVAALRRSGLSSVHVANRTPEKAQRLAETANGDGFGLDRVPELLKQVDMVVGCTAGTGVVVTTEQVREAVGSRGGRPLFTLDLALQHNIDPGVGDVPGVTFVDLQRIADEGKDDDELSVASVQAAQRIVEESVTQFRAAQRLTQATPIFAAMRDLAAAATASELDRLARKLDAIDAAAHEEIGRSVRRIVDKVLHQPTVRARQMAGTPEGAVYIEVLGKLFAPEGREENVEAMA